MVATGNLRATQIAHTWSLQQAFVAEDEAKAPNKRHVLATLLSTSTAKATAHDFM